MDHILDFRLDDIRTDGWFERVGESINSFDALCDVLGADFFAFALIVGAQITALTIDRRNPDQTTVEFSLPAPGEVEGAAQQRQQLTLRDFRRRLATELLADEQGGPAPGDSSQLDALQQHLGIRNLLLAPVFGYAMIACEVGADSTQVVVERESVTERLQLAAFQARLRQHVREALQQSLKERAKSSIELSRVADAERAAREGDHEKVLELLGGWPAPLSIFLRTPEGQALAPQNRSLIARGLSLLGSALIALGESLQGEEVLRLAIQYVPHGIVAGDAYLRLGTALLEQQRIGEAVGLLRRARSLGVSGQRVVPLLVRAFVECERWLAAWGMLRLAREIGCQDESLGGYEHQVKGQLGQPLAAWAELVGPSEG